MSTDDEKGPGRPRSRAAHQAILAATLDLLRTTSVRELTIEGIARAAGVGKPTIYRWWPSKNALVIEALFGAVADEVAFPPAATTLAPASAVSGCPAAIAPCTRRSVLPELVDG